MLAFLNVLNLTKLDPMQSLPFLAEHINKKYSKTNNKKQQQQQTALLKPGNESLRYNREEMNLYKFFFSIDFNYFLLFV